MTDVSTLSSTAHVPVAVEQRTAEGQNLTYHLAFAAVGLFVSVLSYALTPAEFWINSGPTIERAPAGLIVSDMEIPAGLPRSAYPAN